MRRTFILSLSACLALAGAPVAHADSPRAQPPTAAERAAVSHALRAAASGQANVAQEVVAITRSNAVSRVVSSPGAPAGNAALAAPAAGQVSRASVPANGQRNNPEASGLGGRAPLSVIPPRSSK
jgi:hypothetical protein